MNPAVQIRLVRHSPEEYAAILGIYRPYVLDSPATFEYQVPSQEDFNERILNITSFYPWVVAEIKDRIVGYAYAGSHRKREAYRWSVETSIYISHSFHRQGIGRALYGALFSWLKRQGIVNVYAGITLPNDKSEDFHKAMGFSPIGVYPKIGYKLGRWHDVLWMSLQLNKPVALPRPPVSIHDVGEMLS